MSFDTLRVTLEKPYFADDPTRPLVMYYGSTPPVFHKMYQALSDDTLFDVSSNSYIDATAAGESRSRLPQPGQLIPYEFVFGDEERNGILCPLEAVITWFGDFRIPKVSSVHSVDPREKFNFVREQVARRWGYWTVPALSQAGRPYCEKGRLDYDSTKIGPPRVPHVLIESLDHRGKIDGKLSWRPWDWYQWELDVVKPAAQAEPQNPLAAFSLGDLERFVEAQKAKEAKLGKAVA